MYICMMCIPVVPALKRLRQENHKIEVTWGPVREGKKKKMRKRGMREEREGKKETEERRREK